MTIYFITCLALFKGLSNFHLYFPNERSFGLPGCPCRTGLEPAPCSPGWSAPDSARSPRSRREVLSGLWAVLQLWRGKNNENKFKSYEIICFYAKGLAFIPNNCICLWPPVRSFKQLLWGWRKTRVTAQPSDTLLGLRWKKCWAQQEPTNLLFYGLQTQLPNLAEKGDLGLCLEELLASICVD